MTFIINYDGWALDYGILEDSDEEEITQAAWNAAMEEAAKVAKEPLDNPTEEEIAQMAQGMTIGEIKANRILKLIEL